MNSANLTQSLSPNLKGQDYFVGDIHGHYESLKKNLERIGFDTSRDRLIAVGDLVDRKPRGDLALHWLNAPFFHSIRGNHEDLYLRWRALKNDPEAQEEFEIRLYFNGPNGGGWVKNHGEDVHSPLEERLARLPYFLTVPTVDGRVIGVVHAELPDGAGWPRLITQLEEGDPKLIETITWGRDRWKALRTGHSVFRDNNQVFGLDAVVCGHVRVKDPVALGNIVYMDTGGWADSGKFSILSSHDILAMVEAETGDSLPASI